MRALPMTNLILVVLALLLGQPATARGKAPYLEGEQLTWAFADLDGEPVHSSDPRFRGKRHCPV